MAAAESMATYLSDQAQLYLSDPRARPSYESRLEAAVMYLGIALRAERQRVGLFAPHIRRITERHCDCGGSPKGEGGCVACQIYHELNEAIRERSE